MSNITSALEKEGIIGDILRPGTSVAHNLEVLWPSTKLKTPGQMIDRDLLLSKPVCIVEPIPEDKLSPPIYVLMMVDPDLTKRNDNTFGQVRHWLVTKCPVSATGEVIDSDGVVVSPYVKPAPIPAHLFVGEPRPSRYTFILCRHKSGKAPDSYDESTLKRHYEGNPGDLGGAPQDIIDRMRFDAQQFIDQNDLEVVAATFMLVEGNVKSGIANMALTAQSVVDKVIGR